MSDGFVVATTYGSRNVGVHLRPSLPACWKWCSPSLLLMEWVAAVSSDLISETFPYRLIEWVVQWDGVNCFLLPQFCWNGSLPRRLSIVFVEGCWDNSLCTFLVSSVEKFSAGVVSTKEFMFCYETLPRICTKLEFSDTSHVYFENAKNFFWSVVFQNNAFSLGCWCEHKWANFFLKWRHAQFSAHLFSCLPQTRVTLESAVILSSPPSDLPLYSWSAFDPQKIKRTVLRPLLADDVLSAYSRNFFVSTSTSHTASSLHSAIPSCLTICLFFWLLKRHKQQCSLSSDPAGALVLS